MGHWIAQAIVKTITWLVLPGCVLLGVYITSRVTEAIDAARDQEAIERRKAAMLAAESDDTNTV